jgi:flagellar basal body rod protein FlgF
VLFAPGVVSTGSQELSIAFAQDGWVSTAVIPE